MGERGNGRVREGCFMRGGAGASSGSRSMEMAAVLDIIGPWALPAKGFTGGRAWPAPAEQEHQTTVGSESLARVSETPAGTTW